MSKMYCVQMLNDDIGETVMGYTTTEEKAKQAKYSVRQYLMEEGWYDCKVFIHPCEVNHLKWYTMEKYI